MDSHKFNVVKNIFYIILLLFTTSCYEQTNNFTDNEYIFNGSGKGTIAGRVTTTYGDGINTAPIGIPNASVQLLIPTSVKDFKLLNTVYTDNDGNFEINDVPSGNYVIVNIKKDGYIENQKITNVVSDKTSYITAAINNLIDPKIFDATEGVKYHSLGVDVEIPGNGLISKSGNNFAGEARLEITVYEASLPYYCDTYPGYFSGMDKDNQKTPLFSFFLVNIKIFDNMNELYLKSGKKAKVSFPILKPLASKAPDIIQIWNYNLMKGEWNEIGTAQKASSKFIGESSETGFLTIAMPVEISYLTGKVIDQNEIPIEHSRVKCRLDNFAWVSETYTDKEGNFTLEVIANSSFTIKADYMTYNSEPKTISQSPSINQSVDIGFITINTTTKIIPGKWVKMQQFTDYNITSITFKDEDTGLITAFKQTTSNLGKIFKTINGGDSWTEVYTGENMAPFQIMYKGDCCFVNAGTNVLKTTNDGTTWDTIGTNTKFIDMYFVDENFGWGFGVLNMRTTDGGISWLSIMDYPFDIYFSVFFSDRLNGWAVGQFNIIKTINGGLSWDLINSGEYLESYTDVYFQSKDIGYLLGQNGLIKKTEDNGQTWISNKQDGLGGLSSVKFVNQSTGWIVGNKGVILFTDNQGSTWQKYDKITDENLKDLFFLNENQGWAVGENGTLLKYKKE